MSWSVSGHGKPRALAANLAAQFARVKCMEPEETIKSGIAATIATALAAFPENQPVKVAASGSQSTDSKNVGEGIATNQLAVSIEPLWGFVE